MHRKSYFFFLLFNFISCSSIQNTQNSLDGDKLKNFKNEKIIMLHETKVDDLIELYGESLITMSMSENNINYQLNIWSSNNIKDYLWNKNIVPAQRELQIKSKDGLITEYFYWSSFKEDQTKYDTDKYKEINKSMPIKNVIELLGNPNGYAQYEIDKNNNLLNLQGKWYYKFIYASPSGYKIKNSDNQTQYIFSSKRLEVIYDRQNKVLNSYSLDVN